MFAARSLKAILAVCLLALAVQAHTGVYDIDAEPNSDNPE